MQLHETIGELAVNQKDDKDDNTYMSFERFARSLASLKILSRQCSKLGPLLCRDIVLFNDVLDRIIGLRLA